MYIAYDRYIYVYINIFIFIGVYPWHVSSTPKLGVKHMEDDAAGCCHFEDQED